MNEEEIDLDKLDDMFEDLGDDDDNIETENIDTGSRDPINKVLKSTKKVISEKMTVDAGLDLIGETADRALPDDLRESKETAKKVTENILNPIKEEVGNLKGSAKTFFGGAAEMAGGDDSFFGSMLGKVKDMLSDDDSDESRREESEDEKITNNVNDILSNMVDQQQATEKYNTKVSEMQGKTQEELLARVVSNLEIMKDHELNIVNSYNRKILELDYKKVFLLDKTFNLLKESTELTGKQLEAISKNTSLPDIVKTRNSEHMEHMIKDKLGKAGMDFLTKNSTVTNITDAIKNKATDVIGNVAQGLDAGNMLMESSNMMSDMGISSTDALMGQLVDGVINKGADKAGKMAMNTLLKTTLGKESSSLINKYGSDIKYGSEELKEILENRDEPISPMVEKLLNFISENAGSSYGTDIDLQSDNPDDVTIFDNKAKKSITTVIPTLLSKILNEVTGIRTGEKPKEEMVYDYYSNKFTNTTTLKREMIHTLNQSNKTVAKDLNSSGLFTVLESKNKLTKEERKIVKDKLYKFISGGGTTSPYFLERAGFLEEFKPELAEKLKENIDTVLNDKGRFSQNLLKEFQDTMERIKGSVNSSISSISSKANKLSMLGRTDLLEELKLTNSKDHTKINSENITNLNSRIISKHTDGSVDLENSDISRSERTQALEIRKKIEEAVRKVKDKDLQGKVKTEVLKKMRQLDIKDYLDLGNVTRNITTLRKFMFDIYKDRLTKKSDKEESWLDEKMPESLKNAKNSVKTGLGNIFKPIGKNIEKTVNDTLGVEEDNKIIVDWDEDELDSDKSKIKNKKHFLDTKKSRKDKYNNTNNGNSFDCITCLEPTNNILNKILDTITPKGIEIKDASTIMEKVNEKKNKKFNGVLDKLDQFKDGGATDPNKDIDEVAGVVHGKEYVINNKKLNNLIDTTKDLLSFTKKKDNVKVDNKNAFDLFTNTVKDLVSSSKEGFNEVAKKVSEMSTPEGYEEKLNKQTFSDIGKSKIDKQLNKVRNNFGDISPEERITAFIKNVFNKDNKDSVAFTIKNAFDSKNKDSVISKISNAFDSNNENSITSKITKAFDKDNKDSILFKIGNAFDPSNKDSLTNKLNANLTNVFKSIAIPRDLKTAKEMLNNSYGTVKDTVTNSDFYKEANTFIDDLHIPNKFNDLIGKQHLDLSTPNKINSNVDTSKIKWKKDETKLESIVSGLENIFSKDNVVKNFNTTKDRVTDVFKKKDGIDNEEMLELKMPNDKAIEKEDISNVVPKSDINIDMKDVDTDNESNALGDILEEHQKAIREKGLTEYLKELLSTESIPDDEEALPFYTRFLTSIDPRGKLLKYIKEKGHFLKTMLGIHMSGIANAGKYLVDAGKAVGRFGVEKAKGAAGFIKNLLPPQLRFIFDNTLVGRLTKTMGSKFTGIGKKLSGIVKANLKAIKDSAKESFTDKDGNTKINLLRGAKFLGKSFINTAKATALGDHKKGIFDKHGKILKDTAKESFYNKDGKLSLNPLNALKFGGKALYRGVKADLVNDGNDEGIRGIYKDAGAIGVDTVKTGLSILGRISGLEKHIPIIRRDLIVENAPIPERVKSMYFNKEIEFETIKRYIPKQDRKKYYQYLKDYKKEIGASRKGLFSKTLKGGFKATKGLAENVVRPGVIGATNGIKDVFKTIKDYTNNLKGKNSKENLEDKKLDKIIKELKPKKKKWNDSDGDGHRNGSFLDRLKMFNKDDKHDKGRMKTILSKAKDSGGILTAIMMGMGFLLGGIKTFFKDGFMSVLGKTFKSLIWEPTKWLGSKVLDLGKNILSGVGDMAKNLIKKIPGYETAKKAVNFVKDKVSGAASWVSDKFSAAKNVVKNSVNFVKDGVVNIAKKGAGLVEKVIGKSAASKLLRLAMKTGSMTKLAGKYVLQAGKRVPLIGMVIGGGTALYHASKGEWGKAAVDLAAGVASTVPYAGIPLSLAVDYYGNKLVDNYHSKHKEKKITNKDVLDEIKVNAPINKSKLLTNLMNDEGLRLHKYKDSLGYDTIGIGHLLDKGKGIPLKNIIGVNKDTITQPEALKILAFDTNRTMKSLYGKAKWLKDKPEPIQESLINMGFNLGVPGLFKFKKAMDNIKNDNYEKAADDFTDSKWYKQVGPRASRIVNNIRNTGMGNKTPDIKAVNNVSYKTLDKLTSPSDKIKEISKNVEKDKKAFKENDMLTKDNKIKNTKINETDSSIVLAKVVDNNNKHISKTIKEKNNGSNDEIIMKSLSVQTEMLATLQGIHEMNKILVENSVPKDKKDEIDKRLDEVNKNNKPKFSEGNIPSAFNMRTGTF